MTTSEASSRKHSALKVLLPVAAIAALAGGALFGLSRLAKAPSSEEGVAVVPGAKLPDFDLQLLDGSKRKFSELGAKIVMINFWASYTFQGTALKGLGLGFGGNSASEYLTLNRLNTGSFALPAYTVLNSSLSYTGRQYSIIIKVNNLANQKYYSGWSTVTPQNLRNASISLNYKF